MNLGKLYGMGGENSMDNAKPHAKNNPNYKENKFTEEEAVMHADKAGDFPPSLNEIPKETNPQ